MKRLLPLLAVLLFPACASVYERCQANFQGLGYYDYQGCVQGENARMQQAAQAMQAYGNSINPRKQTVECTSQPWGNGVRTECR